MSIYSWPIGTSILVKFSRIVNGKGITGQSVSLTLQRRSDSLYWTGSTWGSVTVLSMTLISDSTNPGEFEYTGPTSTVTDTYECHAYISSGAYQCDAYDTILLENSSSGLTQQQIADSLKLAPTAGTPANGSAMAVLAAIPTTPLLTGDSRLPSSGVIAKQGDNMGNVASVTGDVTLAATQPHFTPATVTDLNALANVLVGIIASKCVVSSDGNTVQLYTKAGVLYVTIVATTNITTGVTTWTPTFA